MKDKTSREKYLFIDDEQGLLELVQMNVLEFHPWGARNDNLDRADRIVFDLDPHASVKWSRVIAGARQLREHLESIGLRSYVTLDPKEFVDVAGEKNRAGKIFIDWLRNGRGSTSVASWSLRARASAGVAMPLAWEALARVKSGDAFTIENAVKRLKKLSEDPWADIASIKQALPTLR